MHRERSVKHSLSTDIWKWALGLAVTITLAVVGSWATSVNEKLDPIPSEVSAIKTQQSNFDKRIDSFELNTNKRFDRLDNKLDKLLEDK